jgi:opacity protein-like surface antigen
VSHGFIREFVRTQFKENAMKKYVVTTLACLFISSLSVTAFTAEPGFYVGGNAGLILPDDSTAKFTNVDANITYDPGYTLSAVGGYKFANNIRIEGEIGEKGVTTDKIWAATSTHDNYDSTVSLANFMVNGYYDIKTATFGGFTPYFGGGLGVAVLMTSDANTFDGRILNESADAVFAYQAGVGIAYDVTPKVTLDFGYRYFGTTEGSFEEAATNNDVKMAFSSHNFIVGARYNF